MPQEKMQNCFWCGKELGVYARVPGDEPECCGAVECMRELCYEMQAAEEDRRERAAGDGYSRY